jgi:hypothetical protein
MRNIGRSESDRKKKRRLKEGQQRREGRGVGRPKFFASVLGWIVGRSFLSLSLVGS